MNFKNHQSGNGGYLSMSHDQEEVGRLTYTIMPEKNTLIISFMNVYPAYEERGFGRMLVKEAIAFSREHGWQVHPHCSYVKRVMLKMPNIEDVFSPEL